MWLLARIAWRRIAHNCWICSNAKHLWGNSSLRQEVAAYQLAQNVPWNMCRRLLLIISLVAKLLCVTTAGLLHWGSVHSGRLEGRIEGTCLFRVLPPPQVLPGLHLVRIGRFLVGRCRGCTFLLCLSLPPGIGSIGRIRLVLHGVGILAVVHGVPGHHGIHVGAHHAKGHAVGVGKTPSKATSHHRHAPHAHARLAVLQGVAPGEDTRPHTLLRHVHSWLTPGLGHSHTLPGILEHVAWHLGCLAGCRGWLGLARCAASLSICETLR